MLNPSIGNGVWIPAMLFGILIYASWRVAKKSDGIIPIFPQALVWIVLGLLLPCLYAFIHYGAKDTHLSIALTTVTVWLCAVDFVMVRHLLIPLSSGKGIHFLSPELGRPEHVGWAAGNARPGYSQHDNDGTSRHGEDDTSSTDVNQGLIDLMVLGHLDDRSPSTEVGVDVSGNTTISRIE